MCFAALLRQTDPHWRAYFFITDNKPFSARLEEILSSYDDNRLIQILIPKALQRAVRLLFIYFTDFIHLQYSPVDVGYTATDYALNAILRLNQEPCSWLSVTNGDNIYGTDIVKNVRKISHSSPNPSDLLLTPVNSRNFLYLGKFFLTLVMFSYFQCQTCFLKGWSRHGRIAVEDCQPHFKYLSWDIRYNQNPNLAAWTLQQFSSPESGF